MTKEFADMLECFLQSECSDYGIKYTWEYNSDTNECEVDVYRKDSFPQFETILNFKWKDNKLLLEMGEDIYQSVAEYESTVKYFWMKLAPFAFPHE